MIDTVPRLVNRRPLDPVLLKAIGHPLRHRILMALSERVSSPRRVASDLGEPLGRVSHHVRVLSRIGAIELVDTVRRRGAVEHFYRAVIRAAFDDDDWVHVPRGTRRAVLGRHLARVVEHVSSAAQKGGFDHARAHVIYEPFDLDREGFDAVADILVETVLRVADMRAMNGAGCADEDRQSTLTELAVVFFESA